MSTHATQPILRDAHQREAKVVRVARRVLAVGTIIAGATLALGIVLLLARGGSGGDWSQFVPSEPARGLREIALGALAGDARSVAMLGVVLLVLVPAARVAATMWSFARARAWIFVVSGVIVLTVILVGLSGPIGIIGPLGATPGP